MTTWADVRQYLNSNYKVNDVNATMMALDFGLDDSRSQRVFVYLEMNSNGAEWICIESPFGRIDNVDLRKALTLLEGKIFGAIGFVGPDLVTIKHSTPIGDLNGAELEVPMQLAAVVADELERQLGLGDAF